VRPLLIQESPRACVTSARDSDPGAMLPFELGVLSCTLGHAIDPQMSDQTAAASEAREMLCSFTPARNGPDEAYAGALRSINAGKITGSSAGPTSPVASRPNCRSLSRLQIGRPNIIRRDQNIYAPNTCLNALFGFCFPGHLKFGGVQRLLPRCLGAGHRAKDVASQAR